MFKWLKKYRDRANKEYTESVNKFRFYKKLDEIVMTSILNMRARQIEKYGKCFSEYDIIGIRASVRCSVKPYYNKDRIISEVINKISLYDNELQANLPICVSEYGC